MKPGIPGLLAILLSTAAMAPPSPEPPLLRWDTLRQTHYDPRREIEWPRGLDDLDGTEVRLEGYILPLFGSQDPADLLLAGLHPMSLLCGPTDMTALVEVHLDGFDPGGDWPRLPVEVTGTFRLSRAPENRQAIYQLRARSWKPLRRWEQSFPGMDEDEDEPLDDPGP